MGDPQRLLSNISDADDLERELLGSIQRLDPPAGARGEAWTRLSAQIAAVGVLGTVAHGSAAAAAATGSAAAPGAVAASVGSSLGFGPLALKLFASKAVVGAALAGAAIGVSAVWVHVRNKPEPAAPVVTLAASQAPARASLPAPEPEAANAPDFAPTPETSEVPAARPNVEQSRKDRLSAESALLTRARADLRSGNAAAAQQALDQLRVKFPKGVLGQEREVLSIEVLSARGNTEAARRRAKAFIAAYPKSPHSAQLSRFAEAP